MRSKTNDNRENIQYIIRIKPQGQYDLISGDLQNDICEIKSTCNDSIPGQQGQVIKIEPAVHIMEHPQTAIRNEVTDAKPTMDNQVVKVEQISADQQVEINNETLLASNSLNDDSYMCVKCFQVFSQLDQLTNHMRIHTEHPKKKEVCVKRFTCNVCSKQFLCVSSFAQHMKTHSHKCKVCGKEFTLSSDLTSHLMIHEGEKPYKCGTCGKKFSLSGDLKRHLITYKPCKYWLC